MSNNKANKTKPIKKILEIITDKINALLNIGTIVDSIAKHIEIMASIEPMNIL